MQTRIEEHMDEVMVSVGQAIEARAAELRGEVAVIAGHAEEADYWIWQAWDRAWAIGFESAEQPAALIGASRHRRDGQGAKAALPKDKKQLRKSEEKAKARERLIASGNWAALDLPAPEALLAKLQIGAGVEVEGYRLDYEYGMVWFRNSDGVDGCLGFGLDRQRMMDFLALVARGDPFRGSFKAIPA